MQQISDNEKLQIIVNNENKEIVKSYKKDKKFLKDNGISISTITLHCKFGVNINLHLFAIYTKLSYDGIADIKYGDRTKAASNRTILLNHKKKK